MIRALGIASLLALGSFGSACSSTPAEEESSGSSTSEVKSTADAGDTRSCVPCTERFAAGAKKYSQLRRACFCQDDVCQDACTKTQCTTKFTDPDAECQACIDVSYDRCTATVVSACEADGACADYVNCKIDSACK